MEKIKGSFLIGRSAEPVTRRTERVQGLLFDVQFERPLSVLGNAYIEVFYEIDGEGHRVTHAHWIPDAVNDPDTFEVVGVELAA